MVTIEPGRRGFMRRTASLEPWITAWRLSSSWRIAVASDSSSNGPIGMIPALLTTMSIGPSSCSIRSSAAVKAGRSVTSRARPIAPAPVSAAAASATVASRSAIATRTPSRPREREIALPMPRPPPVTTATFPARERGCFAMRKGSSSGSYSPETVAARSLSKNRRCVRGARAVDAGRRTMVKPIVVLWASRRGAIRRRGSGASGRADFFGGLLEAAQSVAAVGLLELLVQHLAALGDGLDGRRALRLRVGDAPVEEADAVTEVALEGGVEDRVLVRGRDPRGLALHVQVDALHADEVGRDGGSRGRLLQRLDLLLAGAADGVEAAVVGVLDQAAAGGADGVDDRLVDRVAVDVADQRDGLEVRVDDHDGRGLLDVDPARDGLVAGDVLDRPRCHEDLLAIGAHVLELAADGAVVVGAVVPEEEREDLALLDRLAHVLG